jgi:CHAT domain-containing protein
MSHRLTSGVRTREGDGLRAVHPHLMASRLLMLACCLVTAGPLLAQPQDIEALLDGGRRLRAAGDLAAASHRLGQAHARAGDAAQKARAAAELGLVRYEMRRFGDARQLLQEAYDHADTSDAERARLANDLGNAHLGLRQTAEARHWYGLARRLAPADASLQASASLNLAQLAPPAERGEALAAAWRQLDALPGGVEKARYAAHLGMQALALGPAQQRLAYEALDLTRTLAATATPPQPRLQAEALDGLAQLYAAEKRTDEALQLIDEAVLRAQGADARDLLYGLEWRRGRLLRERREMDAATAAYRRAVEHIEAVRQDIPIEYQDGRSSFRETLGPIYLELAELLLAQADAATGETAQRHAREARNVVELVKRSELDDFLGDRCTVESARRTDAGGELPRGTAVIYPIIFERRLEMLVEVAGVLHRRSVPVAAAELQRLVLDFAERLRRREDAHDTARALHAWLLQPLQPLLAAQGVDTLVVVPDGVLRLIPYGALFDGQRYAIEQYAVVTAPALSLTSVAPPRAGAPRMLIAGLAAPGPVVNQLPQWVLDLLSGESPAPPAAAPNATTGRSLFRSAAAPMPARRALTESELKQALALPGVRKEVQHLRERLPSDVLLDESFTLAQFEQHFVTGSYPLVHVASHGVFSSRAADSFLMAHDGLLSMDGLQRLLRSEKLRQQPIELLTLSACQTAEGDDRAPLGLSGAALKARAHSALGTLWPVSDEAAMRLMSRFYDRLGTTGMSKAQVLRSVQQSMLAEPAFTHPFYWAAFILVGSWQ